MTAQQLPAIAALTFHGSRAAVAHLERVNRGRRRSPSPTPREVARDITNGVVEDQLGPRPARHRKEARS